MTGGQESFLSILVKTACFYWKRLQNDGTLNSVQFFLDHCVSLYNSQLTTVHDPMLIRTQILSVL